MKDVAGYVLRRGDRVAVRARVPWAGRVAYWLAGPTLAWVAVRRPGCRWVEHVPAADVLLVSRAKPRNGGQVKKKIRPASRKN